jgi:hypothetical protein
MAESLSLLSNFQKILYDRIEELRCRIHEAHNPIYNEIQPVLILNGFHIKESMNMLRQRSLQRAFVLTGGKGLYYISQDILLVLIQREH